MNCSSHIEFAYYGSDVGRKDISVHCASTNCSSKDPELHVLKSTNLFFLFASNALMLGRYLKTKAKKSSVVGTSIQNLICLILVV